MSRLEGVYQARSEIRAPPSSNVRFSTSVKERYRHKANFKRGKAVPGDLLFSETENHYSPSYLPISEPDFSSFEKVSGHPLPLAITKVQESPNNYNF